MTADRPDVLVIGAGVVGLACALELRQHGLRVEILEAERPGAGASSAAAGMLSPLAESLHGGDLAEACLEARAQWRRWAPELAETSGHTFGYEESGSLFPAFDDQGDAFLDQLSAAGAGCGESIQAMQPGDLRRAFPELSHHARRALFVPGEAVVDPELVVEALTSLLVRAGTLIHNGRPVERITAAGKTGHLLEGPGWRTTVDKVVIAAGAWSCRIEGLPPWVQPVRGQMIAYRAEGWEIRGAIRTQKLYALRRGDEILCGATVEEVGFDDAVTQGALDELVDFSQTILPKLRWKAAQRQWSGLRPGSPDGLPVIGRWSERELYFATGHFRNGILLAPWTAVALAAEITGAPSPALPDSFSPNRFDRKL